MKFAALGRTQMLYDSIKACVLCGHKPVLIGTCRAESESTVNEKDFELLAKDYNCPFFNDSGINNLKYILMAQESGADVAISVNWLTLISHKMIDQFKFGIINAHAGDLPRFRGNACANWAILVGENKVVLTLHQMGVDLDSGPILLQRSFPLTDKTYIGDVYRFMYDSIPKMFCEVLDGLHTGNIIPKIQSTDASLSLRTYPRLPRDSEIDWNQSAQFLARLIRASSEPFCGAYTFLGFEKIIIWRAYEDRLEYPYLGIPGQIISRNNKSGEVGVLTGDGILVLEEIESEICGRVRACDYIKSLRTRLGLDIASWLFQLKSQISNIENILESKYLKTNYDN